MNELKPVAVVHRNSAGQIIIRNMDGSTFDMSKHIGAVIFDAIPDTHRVVSVETLKDAERYAWLKSHAGEKPTQRSMMNEFSENKTEYVFPRLIAWADFCGTITLDEAIDFKLAASKESGQ